MGQSAEDEKHKKQEIESMLPLTPATLNILLALVDTDRHGYGIMQEVDRRTSSGIKLGPGTLYTSIKRMISEGLVEESDQRPDPDMDDQRRRYYRLTGFGERILSAEVERLEKVVKEARRSGVPSRPQTTLPEGA